MLLHWGRGGGRGRDDEHTGAWWWGGGAGPPLAPCSRASPRASPPAPGADRWPAQSLQCGVQGAWGAHFKTPRSVGRSIRTVVCDRKGAGARNSAAPWETAARPLPPPKKRRRTRKLQAHAAGEQDVLRLDVAVHDAARVEVMPPGLGWCLQRCRCGGLGEAAGLVAWAGRLGSGCCQLKADAIARVCGG